MLFLLFHLLLFLLASLWRSLNFLIFFLLFIPSLPGSRQLLCSFFFLRHILFLWRSCISYYGTGCVLYYTGPSYQHLTQQTYTTVVLFFSLLHILYWLVACIYYTGLGILYHWRYFYV